VGSEEHPAKDKKGYMSRYYPESRFGGFTNVDGSIAFYLRVRSLLTPSAFVLDVGCGRGGRADDPVPVRRDLRMLKGRCRHVLGIDVDKRITENPFVDEYRSIEGDRWPVEDGVVDLCLSDNVLEHVPCPDRFFAECRRTIKPGGYLCLRTPNALNYISIASKIIPDRFQLAVLKKVSHTQREEEDIYPTVFRCNTKRRLRRMLDKHGFEHCVFGFEAEPYHLSLCRLTYWLGVMHQRLVPDFLKSTLFAFARKRP
jgi:SAM-dependent methyltransferase